MPHQGVEHRVNKRKDPLMLSEFTSALRRAAPTLLEDIAGAAALVVLFAIALHLPELV